MPKRLLVILNHTLTNQQIQDASDCFGQVDILELDECGKELWNNVPSQAIALKGYLMPLLEQIDAVINSGDLVLIQGDFGATYITVQYCFNNGYVPIYSTNKRTVLTEVIDCDRVETRRIFKHERFRLYER